MTAAATHPDTLSPMRADREQLTHLLRGLAARLDQLDRSLADLSWQGRTTHLSLAFGEIVCEKTALESERERLSDRLTALADQLSTLDSLLSRTDCTDAQPSGRVGTCPYCGYPSLGSGLCAFCRPQTAR